MPLDDDDKVIELQQRRDRQAESERLQNTDLANVRRFMQQHGDDVRWTPECHWMVWDGRRWQVDDLSRVRVKAKQTAESIYDEIRGSNERDKLFKHAERSQSARGISDMLQLAQSEPQIALHLSEFDANPLALNCANGVVDLKSGKLRPHRRADLHSKISPVEYDPDASCNRWMAFLKQVIGGDISLLNFLQVAVGYSLTGLTSEQVLFFLFGHGANGKSVFIELLMRLLGDYAMTARSETIMARRGDGIPNDIARLAGSRLVTINETAEGQRLHEPLLKDLTGGDTVAARFLHREYFEFTPQFKLWIRGNHKPTIIGTDLGIWRRIRLVPFAVTIPENERDPNLGSKLADELPGILSWAVKGAQTWLRAGLAIPDVISDAIQEYKAEEDILGAFIDEQCRVDRNTQVTAKALYGAYHAWADRAGETCVSQRRFGMAIRDRGFDKTKSGGRTVYHGLELPVDERHEL